MRITRVDVFTLPELRSPGAAGSEVSVRLTTDAGLTGWGAVDGDLIGVSGESPTGIVTVLRDHLGPRVLGRTLVERAALLADLDRSLVGNRAARAALDIALHDLAARAAGVSLVRWLGGRRRPEVFGAARLASGALETTVVDARAHVSRGFRVLTIPVGLGRFEQDVARARAVREAVGEDVQLVVEVGRAWTVKQAVSRIRALEPLGVMCVTQPVAALDLLGMAEVARSVGVPLAAKEGLGTLRPPTSSCTGPRGSRAIRRAGSRSVTGGRRSRRRPASA